MVGLELLLKFKHHVQLAFDSSMWYNVLHCGLSLLFVILILHSDQDWHIAAWIIEGDNIY